MTNMSMSFDPCKRFSSVSQTLEGKNQEKSLDAIALAGQVEENTTSAYDLAALEWLHVQSSNFTEQDYRD
jgi:hypothetical protein